jgi:predicted nucleic acid-binding protein
MGSSPSRLAEHHRTLVIDASVAINLLGSGDPVMLLRPLQRRVVIEETARDEVMRNPMNGQLARPALDQLVEGRLLQYERLGERGYSQFLDLTGADPPNDLGDGEAATIAHAEDISGVILLDERKAARIAAMRSSATEILSTLDIISTPCVAGSIGRDRLADLTIAMLRNARMRVAPQFRVWVIELIGEERVASCQSMGLGPR